jgi:hypothetical protein
MTISEWVEYIRKPEVLNDTERLTAVVAAIFEEGGRFKVEEIRRNVEELGIVCLRDYDIPIRGNLL